MTKILVALIAAGSALIGGFITIAGQFSIEWWRERPRRKADAGRKKLLLRMLNEPAHTWRKFERLKRVIGADDEATKRLLIEVGARGSEDGDDVWGLLSRNPFKGEQ
ncbi:MAG TPA: hypothetical protein VGM73_00830 [Candidatus Didemnitutus sp.]|jgi:hypothetical protein